MINNSLEQQNLNPDHLLDNLQEGYRNIVISLILIILIIWITSFLMIMAFIFSGLDYQAGIGIAIIYGKIIIIALFISLMLSIINLMLIYKANLKKTSAYILIILSLIFSNGLLIYYNITYKYALQQQKEYNSAVNQSLEAIKQIKISEITFPSDLKEEIYQKGQLIRKVEFDSSGFGQSSKEVYYFDEKTKTLKEYQPDFWIKNNVKHPSQYSPSFHKLILLDNSNKVFLINFINQKAYFLDNKTFIPEVNIDKSSGVFYLQNLNYDKYIIDEQKLEIIKTSQIFYRCYGINATNHSDSIKKFLNSFNLSSKQHLFKNPNYYLSWVNFGNHKQLGFTSADELFYSDSTKKEVYIIDNSGQRYSFEAMCNTDK